MKTTNDFWYAMNLVRQYAHQTDSNGFECLADDLHNAGDDSEVKDVLCSAVRSYFEARLENGEAVTDTEDKRNALDRLDRAAHFSLEAFGGTLAEVVNYALHDRHPEAR